MCILQSKGLSRVCTIRNCQFFGAQSSLWSNAHIRTWLPEKPQLWLDGSLSAKWSLLFNILSRSVIAFLPRSKCLNFMTVVTICSDFGAPQNKVSLCPLFPHLFAMKWWDCMPWSSFFECCVSSQLFDSPLSLLSRGSLIPLPFLPEEWCHLHSKSEVSDISPCTLDYYYKTFIISFIHFHTCYAIC